MFFILSLDSMGYHSYSDENDPNWEDDSEKERREENKPVKYPKPPGFRCWGCSEFLFFGFFLAVFLLIIFTIKGC